MMVSMSKSQRLRTTAEGFMTGLVVCGFRGPWRWNHLDWELPFYQAWRQWEPQQNNPERFPTFEVGGYGRTSQAREMLWELKRTSPFHGYMEEELPSDPLGLPPEDYLEIYADSATPPEWIALAQEFLARTRPST